jgi:oxygen-independent coproporphyrinogen-3 oxidase
MQNKDLIQKYNIQGPRYTSYPTVPFWQDDSINNENWIDTVKKSFNQTNSTQGISLYIHMPYCESLCTFCACHKHITTNHSVEEDYIDTLLKEWKLYIDILDEIPYIKELHLGGGTPTFFSSQHLKKLINGIFKYAKQSENHNFSFEAHPNETTKEQMQTLFDLGFTRTSFGIQDYDDTVQQAIHRKQSYETVKNINTIAKKIGYSSISHDIIFGLPFQTKQSIINTIEKTVKLKPDRIAYYSYAHVPWIKGVGQRGFDEKDLPKNETKRELYELGKELFFEAGYEEIGMDHFALKDDSLFKAIDNKTLHRNFMGYTSDKTQLMIGLGMSAISDTWYSFGQNEKKISDYKQRVNDKQLPIFRGHLLSDKDLIIRKHILNLMCTLETSWSDDSMKIEELPHILNRLQEMQEDELIEIYSDKIIVKPTSKMFVRNVCMAFDLRLANKQPKGQIFSMTI